MILYLEILCNTVVMNVLKSYLILKGPYPVMILTSTSCLCGRIKPRESSGVTWAVSFQLVDKPMAVAAAAAAATGNATLAFVKQR